MCAQPWEGGQTAQREGSKWPQSLLPLPGPATKGCYAAHTGFSPARAILSLTYSNYCVLPSQGGIRLAGQLVPGCPAPNRGDSISRDPR